MFNPSIFQQNLNNTSKTSLLSTHIESISLKSKNDSVSFVTDHLKIYLSYTYSTIFVKIINNLTFHNYERTIYEHDIQDNKFKINELYTFILKSLKKDENHTFTCNILPEHMNISMNAIFNEYFKIHYDISLDKKESSIIDKGSNTLLYEELKEDYTKLKKSYDDLVIQSTTFLEIQTELSTKVNSLFEICNNIEIIIGYASLETNQMYFIYSNVINDILKINVILSPYQVIPKQIVIYFSKIKRLTKLKKIFAYKSVPIILLDDQNNTVLDTSLLDNYCKTNNIEIFFF